MTIVFPDGIKALGNTSVVVAPALANPAAPTVAEVTGAAAVNASCYLYSSFSANVTAARGDKPKRFCEKKTRQGFGPETTEISDLQYVEAPQGTDTDPANKVRVAMTPYTTQYVVERRGLPADTAVLAVGDRVNVHQVELGPQSRTRTGDGDQDEFSVTQPVAQLRSWYDVAIVA